MAVTELLWQETHPGFLLCDLGSKARTEDLAFEHFAGNTDKDVPPSAKNRRRCLVPDFATPEIRRQHRPEQRNRGAIDAADIDQRLGAGSGWQVCLRRGPGRAGNGTTRRPAPPLTTEETAANDSSPRSRNPP
jgi:hypothetical protein